MAKTRECCSALSLRRTGDDLHVSLHKGFKIRLAGIVPVFIEFTGPYCLRDVAVLACLELVISISGSISISYTTWIWLYLPEERTRDMHVS